MFEVRSIYVSIGIIINLYFVVDSYSILTIFTLSFSFRIQTSLGSSFNLHEGSFSFYSDYQLTHCFIKEFHGFFLLTVGSLVIDQFHKKCHFDLRLYVISLMFSLPFIQGVSSYVYVIPCFLSPFSFIYPFGFIQTDVLCCQYRI